MNVFVFGATGRMGQSVVEQIKKRQWNQVGSYSRSQGLQSPSTPPDLVVDFSLPEATPELVKFARQNPCAVVSGTTGWTDESFHQLQSLKTHCPIFWSANMSFGVYLMCRLTETLSAYENFYQYRIEEIHHIHKKDKPSGTALIIEQAARRKTQTLEPIQSIREGEVFGVHRFLASNSNESLEIRHEAFNRDLFASGALDVGQWLVHQPAGFYQMEDFFKQFQS